MDFIKKYKFYIVGILIISIVGYFAISRYSNKQIVFRCPGDYANSEERQIAFSNFREDYYNTHPDSDAVDFAEARKRFYINNNCSIDTELIKQERDRIVLDIIQGVFPITWESLKLDDFECPDQYGDANQYLNYSNRFKKQLKNNDPYVTDTEMERVSHGLLVANNCPDKDISFGDRNSLSNP